MKHLLASLAIMMLLSSPAHAKNGGGVGDAPVIVPSEAVGPYQSQQLRDDSSAHWQPSGEGFVVVTGICSLVSSQVLNSDRRIGAPRYLYQDRLWDVAAIEPSDPPDVVATKMQAFWNENNHRLRCDTSGFNVPNGYLLKFAVARRSDQFLNDMLRVWRVDLNWVDPADGKTTLDYIRDQRQRSQSPAIIRILDRYYRNFRAAGALHREELP